jgi:3'-phosphoadenosine 5'-phosphosulfate sulfotransferase (PAPS reductase)/FAD synthetase
VTGLVTLGVKRAGLIDRGVELNDEIRKLLAAGAPVAIGVSGGKDSCAAALATNEHLDAIGHTGPRILIHADLGRVEWTDSIRVCERLAQQTGLELMVVRRTAGDMMDRWHKRWENNLRRYINLECVKLILPWSTPEMRFCTSELKSAVMAAALVRRFPGQRIVSACGVRREESKNRSKAPTAKDNKRLTNAKHRTTGIDWNPIAAWSETDVFAFCAARSFVMHEGYTRYGMSRISCAYCIMAKQSDLIASATCAENAAIYRVMVALEIASTFAFQGSHWLGDVAPHLLDAGTLYALQGAKARGAQRAYCEAQIPKHLLYTKGWPEVMPTLAEAELLCAVRAEVAELVGIKIKHNRPAALVARYAQLMEIKRIKDDAKRRKLERGNSRSRS